MARARVKRHYSDPDILSRQSSLTIGNKAVAGPIRSLHLSPSRLSESRMISSNSLRGINEIHRYLTSDFLNDMDGDATKQQEFIATISAPVSKIDSEKEITLLAFSFDNGGSAPTDDEIEYMCDLLVAPFNDAIIPPIIAGLNSAAYMDFLKRFFSALGSNKSKPTIGLIPYSSHRDIQAFVDFYSKKDINVFAMDLVGKHPMRMYPNIRRVVRALSALEHDLKEDVYLHGLNVKYGRSLPKLPAVPAKDVLAFTMGFDSFGSSHIRRKMPPGLTQSTSSPLKDVRLFARGSYGYYRADLPNIGSILGTESDSPVSLDSFSENRRDRRKLGLLQKVFNTDRHAREAATLRSKLKDGKAYAHISSKSDVKDEMQMVLKLRSESREKR